MKQNILRIYTVMPYIKYAENSEISLKILLGDGVMETHLLKSKGLVRFDSLPPKGI